VVARGQQAAMPVIGFLSAGSFDGLAAFHRGLGDTGYIVGRNLDIVYRNTDGQYDRLPAMAADLVRLRVSVICTAPTSATLAAKTATATIPIVFNIGPDPARAGLVAALNHPGGNLTGIARLVGELGLKQMSLLHEAAPKVDTMGFLVNPNNPRTEALIRSMHVAAESQKLKLVVVGAERAGDLEMAFETLVRQRVGAVVVAADSYLGSEIDAEAGDLTASPPAMVGPSKGRPPMSHRKTNLGISCIQKICQSSASARPHKLA
jgi:putative ABC transport system substrate-binding protein